MKIFLHLLFIYHAFVHHKLKYSNLGECYLVFSTQNIHYIRRNILKII